MAKKFLTNISAENNDMQNVDSIAFNTSTTETPAAGKISWNPDFETLNVGLDTNVTLQVGQEHVIRVKNNSGSVAIPDFTFVMFAGATGDTVKVSPAVTDGTIDHQYMVGVTTEEIPADGFGFVTVMGFINNVDTSSYTLGQLLYPNPSVAGGFTTTQPSAPAFDLPVAGVTRVNANSGRVLVRMNNGLRLKDLHDVQIDSPADNEVLSYNSANGTWTNQTATEAGLIDTSSTAQSKSGNFTAPEVHATVKLVAETVGNDEGGEILLGKPETNTTLAGTGVTIDVWQNRLRFFEQGGDARGYYIDITNGGNGVSTNLVGGGSASNSFTTISTPSGTSPVADSSTDTLTLAAGNGITITGDSSADSVTIASTLSKVYYQTSAPSSPQVGDVWVDSDDTVAGYTGLPQVSTSTGLSLTSEHNGKHIYTTVTGRTHTIPANSSVALDIGTTFVFINPGSVTTTIAITSDTMYLSPAGTTGSRTLAPYGMATAVKVTSTSWIISGNGLS